MNKLKSLYALIFVVAMIACGDDEKPSFKQTDFYATWQIDGSENGDCTDLIKINESMFFSGTKCNANQTFDNGMTYTYKNNTFSITYPDLDLTVKYVIRSKTATTMKADLYWETVKMDTQTLTKL